MRVWLELARISNLPTVWTNVLAGWLLAGGGWDGSSLLWLWLGGSLLYTGGMFLNDAADARWDRQHRSERPIAIGKVSERAVWIASIVSLTAGCLSMWLGGANGWMVFALLVAIVAYDLYHKPWKGAVLVMGMCRVLLYLTAGSAVLEGWDWIENGALLAKAIVLGTYVVGLTMVARWEATGAGAPWERWLGWSLLVWPALMAIGETCDLGTSVLFSALGISLAVFQLGYVILICRLMVRPPKSNIGRGVGLLLAGIAWVDALAVLKINLWLALGFAALTPLLRLWQRKIAAT